MISFCVEILPQVKFSTKMTMSLKQAVAHNYACSIEDAGKTGFYRSRSQFQSVAVKSIFIFFLFFAFLVLFCKKVRKSLKKFRTCSCELFRTFTNFFDGFSELSANLFSYLSAYLFGYFSANFFILH